jgi:hypothetical protein
MVAPLIQRRSTAVPSVVKHVSSPVTNYCRWYVCPKLSSDTFSLWFSLSMSDQASHPYKIISKLYSCVLYKQYLFVICKHGVNDTLFEESISNNIRVTGHNTIYIGGYSHQKIHCSTDGLCNAVLEDGTIHSFCSLSYDRSVASSKASSPQGAI